MDQLLSALFSFPTAIFSVLVGIAVLYWLLVILGALDLDLFGFGDHDAGHDAGHDHDSDAGHNPHVVLEFLRVGQVPLTIIVSFFVVYAWIVSLAASTFVRPVVPGWSWWLFGGLAFITSVIGSFFATGLCTAPLAKVFSIKSQRAAHDIIGRLVEVTSSTVDPRFGTARHDLASGEDLLLNVVCEPHHQLAKGDQAVIMAYDRTSGVYHIAPLPHTRPGFLTETPPDTRPPAEAPPVEQRQAPQ